MNKIKTISILGPTASGKTSLSIELAKRLNGEIVSCDSMQLYKDMNIGTATPSIAERDGIPHHLLDIIEPSEEFSCADYAYTAGACIEDIAMRGKLPILCGGTGMYHDALMKITEFSDSDRNEELRSELYAVAEQDGAEALHSRLREVDPDAAMLIHPNNVKRVVRALEVYMTTGKTKTQTDRAQLAGESKYDDIEFIIDFHDRAKLYERIEKRVDIMLSEGLEEEARKLLFGGKRLSKTAYQAIGYKELLPYFSGEISIDEAASQIKLATRHYAKRQLMWFRRDKNSYRIVPDEGDIMKTTAELADEVCLILEKNL